MNDVCIVGGGVAGMTAAIYLCRAGINTTIFAGNEMTGGSISNASIVQNYPGFKEISGIDLSTKIQDQMLQYENLKIYYDEVYKIKPVFIDDSVYAVHNISEQVYSFKGIIAATGTVQRKLNIDNFDSFIGKGVSFCAVCDGAFCANKTAVVIGGGNTAISTAIYLSAIASKVIVLNRSEKFRADSNVLEKAKSKNNIQILTNTQINKIIPKENGFVDSIITNNGFKIETTMIFCCIGSIPNTSLFDFLKLDQEKYIKTYDNSTRTSSNGIFACGDCANPNYKQVIVAAGTGAMAAMDCIKYLNEN